MQREFITQIKEIVPRTYNVKSFRVDDKGGANFKAGQFMYVSFNDSSELSRYLSISSSPTETGFVEFTKKITESEFSKRLDAIKAGDGIKIKYPFGNFTLEKGYKKISFLTGGIGITPVRSICRYVFDSKLGIDVVLIYGNRTSKDIAFKEDFDMIMKEIPNFKTVHILSEPEDSWQGKRGYIDRQLIKDEVPDYLERKFYICGPPMMVLGMKKILLEELHLPEENITTEDFAGY